MKKNAIIITTMPTPQPSRRLFPKDFLWGAATAAHQVEGGNHNQWTDWEEENHVKFARLAPKRSVWPAQGTLQDVPSWKYVKYVATDPKNYLSGRSVEHYSRYYEDFDHLKEIGLNSFRFSIEWSRIEPREGEWDEAQIAHYKQYIVELRKRHIEPFPTLWHWTVPVWFAEKGGFEKRENLKYFERFVEKISKELLGNMRYITTLNEPNVYAFSGYVLEDHPPGKRNVFMALRVYFHLMLAHRRVYRTLKKQHPKAQIGYSAALINIQAKRPHNYIDELSTQVLRYCWNWWFPNRIRKEMDFFGVNYYLTWYLQGAKIKNPTLPINDMGWYMEPEGIYPLFVRIYDRYKKPIIVTENGVPDTRDEYRRWWLEQTMIAIERALSEGIQIKGYLHWSLLDNFEWAFGWWPNFGLIEVDRKTMKRTIRPSAYWYRDWIRHQMRK
jgi:beta-glucosidase